MPQAVNLYLATIDESADQKDWARSVAKLSADMGIGSYVAHWSGKEGRPDCGFGAGVGVVVMNV